MPHLRSHTLIRSFWLWCLSMRRCCATTPLHTLHLCNRPSQLTATDVLTAMFVCDKPGPGVIVSGVWPPIPMDEWQLIMDPRKVEEFRKKWTKDMKAALRELDGSVGSPDQGTKSQPRIRSEKAAPHLPSPSEFPLGFATQQQRVRVDKAAPHLPSATEFPLDLAMKLEETFENDSELGNPIVDKSDWAPPTEHKPMEMEKQEKPAPPRPPPVPQGGSQKASHVSPKMMLLKAHHALKERVAKDTTKTKKKKDGRGANSSKLKRLAVESDSNTTAGSEADEEKPATKKEKGDGGKSVQASAPKKKKSAKASVPQPQEGPKQDPKEEKSPKKASDHGTPHANEPDAPEKATSAAEV